VRAQDAALSWGAICADYSCCAQSDIDMNMQIHDGPQVYTKESHPHMSECTQGLDCSWPRWSCWAPHEASTCHHWECEGATQHSYRVTIG
jgi:hypothetical protein